MKGLFSEWIKDVEYRPVVTAYYYMQWTQYEMSDHTHRSMEIMYVINGHCLVEVGEPGASRRAISMKKGEFIFLDGRVPHRLVVETSCRMLNVEFGFTERASLLPSLKQLAEEDTMLAALFECPRPFLVLREPHNIYHGLKSLILELDSPSKRETMVQLLLAELLLRISEIYRDLEADGDQGKERYVRQAIEYMNEHYDQNVTVADVAKHVSLHPAYVQKIFKGVTGHSILEYLTIHRIEKTKMFLRQTDVPIIEIADYVGISSRQYLHYVFKKHTGMTPVEYRQSVESQNFATENSYRF